METELEDRKMVCERLVSVEAQLESVSGQLDRIEHRMEARTQDGSRFSSIQARVFAARGSSNRRQR
ncbi:hypothetical protein [Hyphomonas adhaerens]|uniref:hypothetical protein n=1 Tax=Hyphomonas adhaerens TaxID=81029 RepID=UPI002356721B|nr:hypothetical protein [Hyphomonas adhaerens]